MKARILLSFFLVTFMSCNSDPTVCECIELTSELKNLEEPLEAGDPRITKLQDCDRANDNYTDEEKAKAKQEALNCK